MKPGIFDNDLPRFVYLYSELHISFCLPIAIGMLFCPLHIHYICQMEVNDELVDKLAHLARLKFGASEKEEIKNDLQKMIAFVEKLNELDTTNVEPLLHMTSEVNVLREDEIKGSISREEALENAPQHNEKFFIVPKVIRNTKDNADSIGS